MEYYNYHHIYMYVYTHKMNDLSSPTYSMHFIPHPQVPYKYQLTPLNSRIFSQKPFFLFVFLKMGFLSLETLVLLHLSVLLLSCLNVLGSYDGVMSIADTPDKRPQPPSQETAKPPVQPAPSHAPTQPPSHAQTQPPSRAPTQPPSRTPSPLPPRKFVAVQGVVYCKDCKYLGINTLLKAKPLFGAVVQLQCNNTRNPLVVQTKTDKNGYFFISAPKTLTNYGSHKCKVSIVSSPLPTCNMPTNLHYGLLGAFLMPLNKPPISTHPIGFDLFNVGPFAFEPSSKEQCQR